jgi:flagellar assembly protein FliH
LFRIDKTLVSYDRSDSEYTSINTLLNPENKFSEVSAEGRAKAQLMKQIEDRLQSRIEEIEKVAEDIISEANKKTKDIMRQAEVKAAEIAKKAEDKGYREGAAIAEKEKEAQFHNNIKALQSLIEQVGGTRTAIIDELEDDIITLVLDTAKKVINMELEKNDKVFVELVQNALGQMKREGKIVVRVGPDEFSSLFSSGNAEFLLDNERIRTSVVEEPMFGRGDCVIESEGETVNAGINSQLKHIEFAFRNDESFIA